MPWYWGDLHNHCSVSYGQGVPSLVLAQAAEHLDFCSITGHAFWPDMPMDLTYQDDFIGMHLGGFAKLQHYWPHLTKQLADANQPGHFVTLPSYEWHSMAFGDHNCYFNCDDPPLVNASDPGSLDEELRTLGFAAMVLPHHIGYSRGHRGLNWDAFDAVRSPLVEIFSNHGCGEADDAYYDYYHSMGARLSNSMVRHGLTLGHRFGFIASTDSHDGYPGHYGHGRTGIFTDHLDRSSLWSSLQNRRTVASTGPRFEVDFSLDNQPLGSIVSRREQMMLCADVVGNAPINAVELVVGNDHGWRVRQLPVADLISEFIPGRQKIKIELGWGFDRQRSTWHVDASVENGHLLGVEPCFRYSGYGSERSEPREKILVCDERHVTCICEAIANPAGLIAGTHFNSGGTQAIVLDIDADEKTNINIVCDQYCSKIRVADLASGSIGASVSGFISPSVKIHRAVPEREFSFRYQQMFRPEKSDRGYIYLRFRQVDGQQGWASPIWFE